MQTIRSSPIPVSIFFCGNSGYSEDTYNRWVEVGVDPTHLVPIEDNFWEIGAGPSGPDTEIFFDRGEVYDPEHVGLKL